MGLNWIFSNKNKKQLNRYELVAFNFSYTILS